MYEVESSESYSVNDGSSDTDPFTDSSESGGQLLTSITPTSSEIRVTPNNNSGSSPGIMVKKNEKISKHETFKTEVFRRDQLEKDIFENEDFKDDFRTEEFRKKDDFQNQPPNKSYYDGDEQQRAIQVARAKLAAAKAHLENCEDYTSSSACSLYIVLILKMKTKS